MAAGLRKIEVASGISWIEVPEADLRILCGCPADAVKHMMRHGLILPTQVGGVRTETGPNAILLSDVMVQNGAFCNLGEFPILQMFYRQGMLLPGHPNNSGTKPLLIGRPEQLQAQLHYIYRGNYGLISEEELQDAGLDVETARDMMRLKLKFAFGRIQHPRQLLDSLPLADEEVEIRNGVTVRRRDLNVFEFGYKGQTETVDLNLPPFEMHECPYTLGFHQIPREYFAVVHSGDGDGWDIRRPSMGAVLVYQGGIYLVDAGPNLIYALNALGIGINEVEGIFHTHCHDDHFAGLTTLIRADRRIKYFATPMVRASVAKKLAALLSIEEEDFSDFFEVHDLVQGDWNDVAGLEVKPIFSPHPVETTPFIFRVLSESGYRSYAHFADIIGLKLLHGMITDDPAAPGLSKEWMARVVADYAEPADVKKVDIGGGLIHGQAEDFISDTSGKIILSHTALKLTDLQKRIGSGASFGTVDVLIPSNRDFARRSAYGHLASYFPTVMDSHLQILLNSPLVTFNPETILIKEGFVGDAIYLLLTGQVEMLSHESPIRSQLSSGALLGELAGLHGLPSLETYRATSYVQALRLSSELYSEFVKRHNLFGDISRLMESREFLQRSWLFGEVVSTGTLNAIANGMTTRSFAAGEPLLVGDRHVALIRHGEAARVAGGRELERLGPGDFLGEETAVFETPRLSEVIATQPTDVYVLAAATLARIPGVRWKLFETFHRRTRACSQGHGEEGEGGGELPWRPEYSVNIQRIDNHHRRLLELSSRLIEAMRKNKGETETAESMEALIAFALYHFTEEEMMLKRYGYPELQGHGSKHKRLMAQVHDLEQRIAARSMSVAEVLAFLEDWIITHILMEDRRYAPFVNDKGVY
ncbi:cyclic nucleotide-binding protein [Paramagnetospirillum marisnigri]|uniref:Cyclic nucleotide-binding protein n=1 Tax=Paramagnetospirillum marisnigri TaxID=1285242 RepID=A0A178MVT5_9PROT|nr:bacteriohemerythrin [Paramagnetospirillum marisnigri]OAN53150.1 cyclic nucleotide-binding protein [Paramagnetospirillum marisnigri]